MKVGIISDTHDWLKGLEEGAKIFEKEKVELIIHCGDWVSPFAIEFFFQKIKSIKVPIKTVFGNNPGDVKRIITENFKRGGSLELSTKDTLALDIDSKKCVIYHGQDKTILETLIDSQRYDAVFTGHTHAQRNEIKGKTLVLNPGTTCFACEGEIIEKGSVAIYDSSTNTAKFITF